MTKVFLIKKLIDVFDSLTQDEIENCILEMQEKDEYSDEEYLKIHLACYKKFISKKYGKTELPKIGVANNEYYNKWSKK